VDERRFRWALVAIVVCAFAVRLVYALAIAPGQIQPGDPLLYHVLADALANGRGYNLEAIYHQSHPTAAHPPLYPLYLAVFVKLGLTTFGAQRAISCLLGAATVALLGLLGKRVAGERAGLLAAGIGAVYPQLFMVDGTLIAESLYAPLIVLVLLLTYRVLDKPTPARAAALGATIGLATLTRSDGIFLAVLLVPPLLWRVGGDRLKLLGAVAVALALVLSPWLIRNWVQFDRFPLLSSNGALTQLATNCDETYYGDKVGFVAHQCALRSPCLKIKAEIPQSECLLREARRYVRDHLGRLPVVVAARVGRLWNLYAPRTDLNYGLLWARQKTTATVGMVMYALLVPFGLLGAIALWRRRTPVFPLLAMFVLAMVVAVIAFGFSRYRLTAEPALVVLAAVGVEQVVAVLTHRRTPVSMFG
jgi:4-amino-4-deoxy-L-arabinose transferase-like glycosyltransferase